MTCINISLWSTDEKPHHPQIFLTYFTLISKVPSGQIDRRSDQEQKDLAVRLQNLGFVIHLDLSYTCPATLSTTLFNFVYLGSVDDCMSGQRFLWKENDNIAISIECASGPVLRRLRLCELLPQRVCVQYLTSISNLHPHSAYKCITSLQFYTRNMYKRHMYTEK